MALLSIFATDSEISGILSLKVSVAEAWTGFKKQLLEDVA
jgi:hypothetical protein